jgi:F-type H+-transporting ATPase subunit c
MKRLVQIVTAIAALCVAGSAFANEAAAEVATKSYDGAGIAYAAAIAIAIAAFGGALGQGMGIKTALESIGRNPSAAGKITTPMIIGLAMIESLVIYALVIALMLVLKL